VTRNETKKIQLHSELAQRRAEEVAVLKMRMRTSQGVKEQLHVEQALVETTQRLGMRIGQMRGHLEQKNLIIPRAEANVIAVREYVPAMEEALRDIDTAHVRSPELVVATEEARRELFELKAVVGTVTIVPEMTEASGALQEAKEGQVNIIKARAKVEWRGISSTVGIDADMKTMGEMVKESEDYFNRGKYPEAYGLAKTAVRLGEKILRALHERGIPRTSF
jgi:plasmid stabilization system protein ParE